MTKRDTLKQIEGAVPVQLRRRDGSVEDHLLMFDLGADYSLCQALGVSSLNAVLKRIQTSWDPQAIRACLWAGLLHEDPELEPEQLNDLAVGREETYDLQVRILSAINRTRISEEEMRQLAINLRTLDASSDPLELTLALNKVLAENRLKRMQEDLASGGTASAGSPGSSSASGTTPGSGDSASESSTGSSSPETGSNSQPTSEPH